MMWATFFRDGGLGMFPTALSGLFLVASGVLLVLRPERRFVALVGSFSVWALASGLLGTTVGVVTACRYVLKTPANEQVRVVALGCAEALNCTVLSLILLATTAVLASIAAVRAAFSRSATR